MKITTSSDNIKSFGGLNFVSTDFEKLKLSELNTQYLRRRSIGATYSFNDAINNLWVITFAGSDCAEDIQTNLKKLVQIENLNVCSPNTILRLQQQ